jgi:N6-L-threonylcarbamoyladenine synthase
MLHSKDFDFSFSGIKTEVRKFVEARGQDSELDDDMKKQIARAFEDAVAEVLVSKTLKAVEEFGAATVIVGGGVSANTYIRDQFSEAICKGPAFTSVTLLVPPPDLATDNALMIALAGYFHAIKNDYADPATLRANGNLKLA